jgi:hypothetical protein
MLLLVGVVESSLSVVQVFLCGFRVLLCVGIGVLMCDLRVL